MTSLSLLYLPHSIRRKRIRKSGTCGSLFLTPRENSVLTYQFLDLSSAYTNVGALPFQNGEENVRNHRLFYIFTLQLFVLQSGISLGQADTDQRSDEWFETQLESFESNLREMMVALELPSVSVGIVKEQKLFWAKGLGYADLNNQIPATPETPYRLASVTKTFASTMIMQLVERGLVNLDDPVSRYGVDLSNADNIKVRHILSHTSDEPPGKYYRYDGNRYIQIGTIIEAASGKSIRDHYIESIIRPLAMSNSAPGDGELSFWDEIFYLAHGYGRNEFDHVYYHLAKPYGIGYTDGEYPRVSAEVLASAGLISNVVDMAQYDIAIDQNHFIALETQELAWTPTVSTDGTVLPYGLGWFSEKYKGVRLIWHGGGWDCISTLYVKVPEMNLTFIIFANSDGLRNAWYPDATSVLHSPAGRLFIDTFVFPGGVE